MAKEKKQKEKKMKKFFEEFKTFITRGNVLDMSVGVIVGGAFTGIVNGLSNFILKPIINWLLAMILGTNGLEGVITMLSPAYALDETGAVIVDEAGKQVVDLTNSIYIDWGAFISAIINFLLIAFVLFAIVKMFNRIAEENQKMRNNPEWNKKKSVARIRMERGVSKKEAVAIWQAQCEEEKARIAEEERVAKEKAEEEKRIAEEKAMANTRLLEEIRDLLKQK